MDFLQRLDPEFAPVLGQLPSLDLTDIPTARARRAELAAATRLPADPRVTREDHLVPGLDGGPAVRVRIYRAVEASGAPRPWLYWIHGGGYVLGSVDQDDPLMEHFVATLGCAAVSVDWRRAPEHPFPAALHDCYAGLLWAFGQAGRLGLDPARIAVGGASSGGGSAAAVALMARDRGDVPIAFQLLIYPMIDDRNVTPSSHLVEHPNLWNRGSNVLAWRAYLGSQSADLDGSGYAAPARASELAGLPATFIASGDLDLFVDEDIEYAQRLRQAGVPIELHIYPGAVHGFELFAPHTRLARQHVRDRDDALRRALGLAASTVDIPEVGP